MKTLDEVINDFEICLKASLNLESCNGCSYADEDDPRCRSHSSADALHYLKEYKTLQYGYIKAIADLEDNPPLSWDELKQMEGKPVWVEERDCHYWAVIGKYESTKSHEFLCFLGLSLMDKDDYGKTWQAYRKERS